MKTSYLLISIMLFVVVSFADQFSISGSVLKQDGTGIEGAEIRLKNYPLFLCKTSASGSFTLDTITPVSFTPVHHAQSALIYVRGTFLTVNTGGVKEPITIDIINSSGRTVYRRQFKQKSSDRHTIQLMSLGIAQGLYLVHVSGHDVQQVIKMVKAGNRFYSNSAILRTATGPCIHANIPANPRAVDTLIVTAPGYKHKIVDVTAYDQIIVCTLSVSNPWIPTGALEYEGGMVKIIAGGYDFEMGQPDPNIWGDGSSRREQPVHTVSFTYDFWMDTVQVIQGDYESLMSATYAGYETPEWMEPYGLGDSLATYCIMWGDAALYCNARSKRDSYDTVYSYDSIKGPPGNLCELINLSIDMSKNGYRLPTEAEWEYACRGGTGTDFYWGKNLENYPANAADTAEISSYAVWTVNSYDVVIGDEWGVYPPALLKPNAYGLYDMSGNLYEWCNDWDNVYTWEDAVDPIGPDTSDVYCRVVRGGSWGNNASHLRSANRYFVPADYLYYFLGFRPVRKVE